MILAVIRLASNQVRKRSDSPDRRARSRTNKMVNGPPRHSTTMTGLMAKPNPLDHSRCCSRYGPSIQMSNVNVAAAQVHTSNAPKTSATLIAQPVKGRRQKPRRLPTSVSRESIGTRTCSVVSRSRMVTAPSSSESKSTVTHSGVPTSSWRR